MNADGLFANTTSTERTVDGATYRLRPIEVADAENDRDLIRHLGPESRYSRLLYSVRESSSIFVHQMVTVDHRHTMAFVAVVGDGDAEVVIGVARYADSADGSRCEFAIAIDDAWQSRGVGTAMSRRLLDYARDQGMLNLSSCILTMNSHGPMQRTR
ncbi:MAG: GNAT family N-acetyltransferase [Steroidobacteraceae bacterium]|nr:GNAT family N-acetyltransferase [Steroidobacteraceae bacterium]